MDDKKVKDQLDTPNKDPLHGVTLEMMLVFLKSKLGWKKMGEIIPINCFITDPSFKSSLTFLRKTSWARQKVETMYLMNIRTKK